MLNPRKQIKKLERTGKQMPYQIKPSVSAVTSPGLQQVSKVTLANNSQALDSAFTKDANGNVVITNASLSSALANGLASIPNAGDIAAIKVGVSVDF
jgi:hypothetical protein